MGVTNGNTSAAMPHILSWQQEGPIACLWAASAPIPAELGSVLNISNMENLAVSPFAAGTKKLGWAAPMLPDEIDPYKFKFFKKDMLPLSETYQLLRESRLLNAKETVNAISKTNQGLVVLVRGAEETAIYTPDSKLLYPAKSRLLDLARVIPGFLKTKMIDFLVLRFERFYLCLARRDRDVCGMHLMTYSDKNESACEKDLLTPSRIVGGLIECVSANEDEFFEFNDLNMFGDPSYARRTTPEDLELNPIDRGAEGSQDVEHKIRSIILDAEKENAPSKTMDLSAISISEDEDGVQEDANYYIQVASEEDGQGDEMFSEPYKEIRENEEGLFDYIASRVLDIINDKENDQPWKMVAEEEAPDSSEAEDRSLPTAVPSEIIKTSKPRKARKKSEKDGTIRFGAIEDGRLQCIQMRIRMLSMAEFNRLEVFIARAVRHLRRSRANYIEVRSEVDFFIVKKDTVCLYIRDLVHRKEGHLLERLARLVDKLNTKT